MTLKHKLTKSGSATSLKLTEALIKLQELELQATENRFKVHSIHDNIAQVMSDYNKVKVMGLNDKELSEAEMNMRGRVENMFDTFDDRNKMGQVTLESVKEGLINTQADEQADPKNAKKKQRQNSGTEDPDDALAEFASEAKKAAAVKKRIEDRLVESQDHLQKAIQEEENARREVAQLMIKLTNAKAEIRRVWEESQEKLEELKKLKTRNNYLEQQGKRFEQTIKKLKESHAQSSKQLEEELKVMETARRNLRDKLDQVDMITNQLENEKDAALKKVGEVEAKLKAAEDEQSQREASIKAEQKALKKQIAALQTQLSTSEAETTSLREQLFNAKRDMEEQLAIAKVKAKEKAEKAVAEKVKEHEATIASLNAEWQAKVDEGIARRKELLAEAEDKLANEIEKGKKLEEDANARAEEARKAAEAEMKKAAEQYEQQIEETKKSLDDVSEKLGDTEALLAKTEQEKSKITNQLDDVNKKYDTLEIEHRETVESLENIKASNADAQKEFTEKIQSLEGTVEKLHNTLENKTNEYESKIAALNKNLTKAQQDLEESSAAGNAQNEELAKLQKALELERVEMEATKESLTSQLGSSDELMETLKSEHANEIARLTSNFELQLHEKDESVAKAMEKMNDDVSNTNTKVLEFEATIDGLQQEIKSLEDTNHQMGQEIETRALNENRLEEEVKALQDRPNTTAPPPKVVVQQLEPVDTATSAVQTDPVSLDGANAHEVQELIAERDYFKTKAAQREAKAQEVSIKVERLESNISALQLTNKSLVEQLSAGEGNGAVDPAILEQLASMQKASTESSQAATAELETITAELAELNKQHYRTSNELKEKSKAFSELETKLAEAEQLSPETIEQMIVEKCKSIRRRLQKQILRFAVLTFKHAKVKLALDDERQIVEQIKAKNLERKHTEASFLGELADGTEQCRVIARRQSKNEKLKSGDHRLMFQRVSQRLLRILQMLQERGVHLTTDDDVKIIEATREKIEAEDEAKSNDPPITLESKLANELGETDVEKKALLLLKKRFGVKFARKTTRRSSLQALSTNKAKEHASKLRNKPRAISKNLNKKRNIPENGGLLQPLAANGMPGSLSQQNFSIAGNTGVPQREEYHTHRLPTSQKPVLRYEAPEQEFEPLGPFQSAFEDSPPAPMRKLDRKTRTAKRLSIW
eukprot:g8124.t1